jgi:outer membrane murein-binding lipoprotein Lpp
VHPASLRRALALLIVVSVCAGCGSSGPSKVSTASYVQSVCSAIAPLERDVVARSQALNNTTSSNALQAKQTLQGFLSAIEQASNRALSKIRSAGTPDISNGKEVAGTVVTAFTQLRDAMHSAGIKASSLPTDSPTSYKTAAQALNASVRASLSNIDPSGFRNPEIEKAAAKEPSCKSLNG